MRSMEAVERPFSGMRRGGEGTGESDLVEGGGFLFFDGFSEREHAETQGARREAEFHDIADFQVVSGLDFFAVDADFARFAGFARDRPSFQYPRYFQEFVYPHIIRLR